MGLDKVKKIVEGILKGDVEISYPPATNLAIYPESPKKPKKKKKKLKQVTEEFFNEGLADMYNKYYSAIDNGLFWKLVNLDPTYKGGDIAGNYARWILKLWTTNNLKTEDFYKVTEYLNDFEANKKKFPNKDIFQFKSLPDLAVGLDSVQDQEVELSNKQKQRQIKKQGFQNAEKVYEDTDWQVWSPNSYEASCNLGSGTRWCTASTSDRYYYDTYSGQGILYVIINNQDPSEKYQFHFESSQFMDKNDREVSLLEFLSEHEGLKEFFSDVAEEHLEKHPELFMLVKDPSNEAIANGMDKLTGYVFKVRDNWVYQEVQLSDLMKEMDSDISDFIDTVYADETKESIWRSLTKNEEISSFVKKFFDVNMREQSLDSFLTLYPDMHGDLVNLLHRYGVISPDTLKQIEDIVGYEKKDFHGSYLKYLWVPFQYYELKSDFSDMGGSIESNAEWMADENLRYNEIYLEDDQEEKIEKIMEDFKEPFDESEQFFEDVMKVFQKHKDILTDKRNNQQKLKLGHESIKAILKQLDMLED